MDIYRHRKKATVGIGKLTLLFLLITASPGLSVAQAEAIGELNADSTYEKTHFKYSARVAVFEEINDLVEKKSGDFSLVARTGANGPDEQSPLGFLDAVWTDAQFHRVLFLLAGVRPNNAQLMGTLSQIQGGYLYHGLTTKGVPYALFLKSFDSKSAADFLKPLNAKLHSATEPLPESGKSWLERISHFGISAAKADDSSECKVGEDPVIPREFLAFAKSFGTDFVRFQYGCIIGMFKGAWAGSLGGVWNMVKGIFDFVTDTDVGRTIRIAQTWMTVNQVWETVEAFVSNFQSEATKSFKGFMSLNAKIRGEIACEVVGTIGAAALTTYFTAGAGAPRLAAAIQTALQRLASFGKYSEVLGTVRSAVVIKDAAGVTKGVMIARNAAHAEKESASTVQTVKELQSELSGTATVAQQEKEVVIAGGSTAKNPIEPLGSGASRPKQTPKKISLKEGREAIQDLRYDLVVANSELAQAEANLVKSQDQYKRLMGIIERAKDHKNPTNDFPDLVQYYKRWKSDEALFLEKQADARTLKKRMKDLEALINPPTP
jgi:hypothetical protein